MNLVKEVSSITPAKAVFGSVSILLTMIKVRFSLSHDQAFMFTYRQDSMANKLDYLELGLECADVCRALDWGMTGKGLGELSGSVCDAIS